MPSFLAKHVESCRLVVFVLFHRVKLLDVTGPLQAFSDCRNSNGQPTYQVTLASLEGGNVETDTGIFLHTISLASLQGCRIDTLLVAGGSSALVAAMSVPLQKQLAMLVSKSRRIGSICTGAFILAQGGHLKGLRATTHWENCLELQIRFPGIRVQEDRIFVKDGSVWTSAGVTSGIDMALAMVEEDAGRTEAMRLARSFVLFLRRPGGQRQYSDALRQQSYENTRHFDHLLSFIHANLSSDLHVSALARIAGMSERTFSRKFTRTFGKGPAKFVEKARVAAACLAFEDNQFSLQQAIHQFGFGSGERMRRAFHRHLGISPADYKKRFGTNAKIRTHDASD